jgi:hypothetical protein
MRTLVACLTIGATLLAGACSHTVQPGYVWNLWGTVVDASPSELRVRHKSGRIVTMQIDAETTVTFENRPAGLDLLTRDARVSVDVELLAGGGQRAKAVRIVWDELAAGTSFPSIGSFTDRVLALRRS